jgi:hypothetical protein
MGWGTSQGTGEGKSLLLIPVILLLHIKADFKKSYVLQTLTLLRVVDTSGGAGRN